MITIIQIEIPTYDKNKGLQYKWEDGFIVETKIEDGQIVISANQAGLISLANHFLSLAQQDVAAGCHMHFDEYNSLEEGSVEMVLEKK